MSIPFRFDTVLRLREIERDIRRQAYTQEQAREKILRDDYNRIAAERLHARNEFRTLQAGSTWSATHAVSYDDYFDRLSRELVEVETMLGEVSVQVTRRREELVEAEIAVKGLQRLSESHQRTQKTDEQAEDERDRDDFRRSERAA
jgi:flagellar export protein FliJ